MSATGQREMWTPCILQDIIDVKHGYAFEGEYFRDEPPGDILLTPGNFEIGGGFKSDKLKYYDGPVPDEYVLEKEDLLITMMDLSKNADTLGYPALVPNPTIGRYLHNQRLGKILVKQDAPIDKRYLYYLLCSREYRHQVVSTATGTTVKHTSPRRILAFKFLRPPVPEQRAIAHILGTLDDKIELNRKMNETLEAIARAIFKSWFVDFDPVRAKAEGRDTGLPREIADLFPSEFEESELGTVPKGWRVAPIGTEVQVVGGSTPSTKEPSYWIDGHVNWATPKDLAGISSPVLIETQKRITEIGLQQISSGLLPVGTVLLSSRAPIGYLAIAHTPIAVNQGFIAMVCEKDLSNHYVLLWAAWNIDTIKSRANGTTFLEVTKANFRPMPVLVPPKKLVQAFEEQVSPLYDSLTSRLLNSEMLASTRVALLPRLLSGEVRVKEAEKFIVRAYRNTPRLEQD